MRFTSKKLLALFCAAGASTYLVGCDNSGTAPDARVISHFDAGVDGGPADAGPDAPPGPDAAPVFSAAIAINEVTINGIPQFGQGLQIAATFSDDSVKPVFATGNIANGCTVTVLTLAQFAASGGFDEGSIAITAADGDPVIPPCTFVGGSYKCIAAQGAGTISVVAAADSGGTLPPGSALLTFATTPVPAFTDAQVLGNYVNVQGAPGPNVGTFPILARQGATSLVVGNPAAASTGATPITGGFAVIAGVGPNPAIPVADASGPLPGVLEDDDNLTVVFTPKTGADFPAFTASFPTGGAANDFELDTASKATISAIPTDGTAFTVGCDPANGCGSGSATGQILVINTTDTAPSASPVDFPAPTTKRVVVQCTKIGGTSITVPAEASAFLMSSGAKRIQAIFLRVALPSSTPALPTGVNVVTGHGIIGFTTP
jgi:hypothetical protein